MEVYVRHYKGAGPGAGVEASLVIIELAGGPRLLRLGRRQGGGTPHRRASRRLLRLDHRWSGGTLLLIVDIILSSTCIHAPPGGTLPVINIHLLIIDDHSVWPPAERPYPSCPSSSRPPRALGKYADEAAKISSSDPYGRT